MSKQTKLSSDTLNSSVIDVAGMMAAYRPVAKPASMTAWFVARKRLAAADGLVVSDVMPGLSEDLLLGLDEAAVPLRLDSRLPLGAPAQAGPAADATVQTAAPEPVSRAVGQPAPEASAVTTKPMPAEPATASGGAVADAGISAMTGAGLPLSATNLAVWGLGVVGVAAAAGGGGSSKPSAPPPDTTPPNAPVITANAANAIINAAEKSAGVTVSGTAEANSTVTVAWGGKTKTATATNGSWSVLFASADVPADGNTTLTATAADAAGNISSQATQNITIDTVAPRISPQMTVNGAAKTVTLTYDSVLDSSRPPAATDFTVTTGNQSNPVVSVTVTGATVTLLLTDTFGAVSVNVAYVDPTEGDDANAIQDIAGNDAASFSTVVVADGYVRGASLYVDVNRNGAVDAADVLIGQTDARGNVLLPANAPSGALLAVGGVNIDTGVPNALVLRAPAGAATINPLTTLVQQLVLDAGGTLNTAQAAAAVVQKLGIALPEGASLLNYDPLAAGDIGVQKVAAQIATLAAGAAGGDSQVAQAVVRNLAGLIRSPSGGTLDLANPTTLGTLLGGVVTDATLLDDLATASAALSGASDLGVITQIQAMLLDKVAPAAPTLSVAELTNDSTPTVRVSFEVGDLSGGAVVAGNTIIVLEGTTPLATGTVTAADLALGYKDLSVVAPLSDGLHNLTAKINDLANNTSMLATEVGVVIDTVPPTGSVSSTIGADGGLVSEIESGQTTRDNTLTLTGETEAGATVIVRDGGVSLGAASVLGTTWTFTTGALADGTHNFTALISDAAGNSFTTSVVTAVVDTTVSPATLNSTLGTDGGVVSSIQSGGATRDTTLALSGTAEAGSLVNVYDGDALLGAATLSGTAWTFVTNALPAGEHRFTAEITDAFGNTVTTSPEVTAVIDLEVSLATLNLTAVTDGGIVASIEDGGRTRDNTLQLSGEVEAGSVVTVLDGVTPLGAATVEGAGWVFVTPQLGDGQHIFSISVTDAVGNTLASETTLSLEIDTLPPQAVSINAIATDEKIVQSEKAEGVRIAVQANGAESVTITFGGTSHAAALDAGLWVADFSSEEIPADGSVSVSVQAVDDVGNVATVTRSVVIDTTADVPTVSSDTTVNRAQIEGGLTVGGTSSAGTINLYRAGEGTPLKTASVAAGSWSVALGLDEIPNDGVYDFEVELVDTDGNVSTRVSHQITADVTDPVAPSITVAAAEDGYLNGTEANQGIVVQATSDDVASLTFRLALASAPDSVIATKTATLVDGVWQATVTAGNLAADGEYVITAVAVDAAGNQAESSANYQVDRTAPTSLSILDITDDHVVNLEEKNNGVRVSVSVQDATGVTITFGATEAVATLDEGTGNWVADFSGDQIPADGSVTVSVVATDVAGNQATATRTVLVDTQVATPTVSGDTLVNAAELSAAQLSGSAPNATTVHLYRAGESDPLASPTVTAGSWSVPIQDWLNEGENAFELVAVDAAGNISERVAYSVTRDTVGPDAPGLNTVADDNFITLPEKTSGVVISGTAEAGTSVQVNFAGAIQTVMAAEDSTWSVTYLAANLPADDPARTLTITATDAAGNIGTPTEVSIGIDTTPPAQPTLNVVAVDDKVNATEIAAGMTLSGTGAAGSVISITLNGVTRNDIVVDDNGNWTADYGAGDLPTSGTQLISVKALDEYQNESAAVTRSVIFDDTAPSLQTATVNGSTVTLTYNEPLDATRQANIASYLLTVNNLGRAITGLAVSGSTAVLTLSSAVAVGDVVKLSYLDLDGDNTYATQDVVGNDAAGLSERTLTNQTTASGADTTAPRLTGGEIAGNVLTLNFNENMQVGVSGTLPTLLLNGASGDVVTQSSRTVSGKTITFNLATTLDTSEYLLVSNPANSRVKDTAGNALAQGGTVIGSSVADTLDFSGRTDFSAGLHIRGNGGDDALRGTFRADVLVGGPGADTLRGHGDADSIYLGEASPATDTVVIGADRESTADKMDLVYGFDTLHVDNTDRLALPAADIAADSGGWVDGTNQGGLHSHRVDAGMVRFGSTDAGTPVLINSGNLATALDYLSRNITTRGQTVGFEVDTDNNGAVDSTCIFQAQVDSLDDVAVMLRGVLGATLSSGSGVDLVQIYDGVGPTSTDISLGTTTLTMFFDENVSAITLDSLETTRYSSSGSEVLTVTAEPLTGSSAEVVLNLGTTLGAGDWLLMRSNTPSQIVVYDAQMNPNELLGAPLSGVALGNAGDKVIDVSAQTGRIDIIDLGGGDDVITGNAENNFIFAGEGADTINGGGGTDSIYGGTGADRYTGSAGADTYTVAQGDTTAVAYTDVGGNGLGSNDTFTFSGGAEVFSGLLSGDTLVLENPGTQGALVRETLGSNGLVGDQKFATVSGVWNDGNDTFTFNTAGTDTLVLFDGNGDSTTPLQHALVLEGVNASEFSVQNNQIVIV